MKFIVFLFPLFIFFGCTATNTENHYQNTLAQEHKTCSEKIRRIMHDLDNVMYQQNRSELERDDERRFYFIVLSKKLKMMSNKMKRIIKDRSEYNPELFLSYTDKVGKKGEEIQLLAENYQFGQLKPILKETLELCKKCHNSFNVNSAVLGHYE